MDILIKPIVTEKMTGQTEDLKCYGFIVDKRANKNQIKKAVQDMYGVSVVSVNTMRYGGKEKSRFSRTGVVRGRSSAFKKAIVSLIDGEVIDFYSNI
ncbi:MAG: 50S ribosomal protein L23 [Porphyromonadaceae bacterium]|nr:MAG: 50S ribosomal protein L23 [Porphyromonadaceae bacterium]